MALIKLTNREMMKLGADLIAPTGKQRRAIDAVPAARELVPTVESALSQLVLSEAPSSGEIAKLTDQLRLVDSRHDDLVRAIDSRLEAELYATTEAKVREVMGQVRLAMFASGRAIIVASYMEESGEVRFRAARVTDDVRRVLKKLKTYEGRTLDELFDELQGVATEIGALEKRRRELGEEGEAIVKNRAARFQWIRAINAIIAVLESQDIDPMPVIGPIRAAEAKAERRGSIRNGATDSDLDGTDTDVTDTDVLDPPVPPDPNPTDVDPIDR